MIKQISIRNFRNLNFYQVDINKPLIFITGENGVGKTSILEAIYFAATTKSHRTSSEKDIIQYGKPFAAVKLVTKSNTFEIIISDSGKRTIINKNEIKKISNYIGKLHVVMFAPEDLMLIKGSPSERRYFLDLELMQSNKEYLRELTTYRKILKQRNALLKKINQNDNYTFLDILGEQLFKSGSIIYDLREKFIEELNENLKVTKTKYKDFDVELVYEPNVTKEQWLKHLKTKQRQDIMYEQTMTGVHKDDFKVLFNGFNSKEYSSQGITRLIVLELKLALLKWIKDQGFDEVILLLDDVLSELDLSNQNLFLETIPKEHQVFITSAIPIDYENDIQNIVLLKEKRTNAE